MQTDIMLPFNWMANKESKLAAKFITYTHTGRYVSPMQIEIGVDRNFHWVPPNHPRKGSDVWNSNAWSFLNVFVDPPLTLLFGWQSIFCNGKVRVINCFGYLNSHFITGFKELATRINHVFSIWLYNSAIRLVMFDMCQPFLLQLNCWP